MEGIVKEKQLARLGIKALAVASLIFSLPVFAGVSLKINNARVDFEAQTLEVSGLGFPTDGSLSITIGDTFLDDCLISQQEITCSLAATPALSGGTWNVRLSAGNSPNANASIDVYILTGLASCNAGDFVSCYSGDASEVGVGQCRTGTRTCSDEGTYGICADEVVAVDEYPSYCRDGVDNDCDGEIDECRDVLTDNPTVFTSNATFMVPPGVSFINIAAAGGGGGGTRGLLCSNCSQTPYSGSGGGSGGIGLVTGYEVPEEDSSFDVHIGFAGSTGFPTGSPGGLSFVRLDGGTTIVQGGGGGPGGILQGGAAGQGDQVLGNSGLPGEVCFFPDPPAPGMQSGFARAGEGGNPVSYDGLISGEGGDGQAIVCDRTCTMEITVLECTIVSRVGGIVRDAFRGRVMVWWDESSP
jgi:hypothetical protein